MSVSFTLHVRQEEKVEVKKCLSDGLVSDCIVRFLFKNVAYNKAFLIEASWTCFPLRPKIEWLIRQ